MRAGPPLLAALVAVPFALAPPVRAETPPVTPPATRLPVVLVHGIWDTGAVWDRLAARLREAGSPSVVAIDLVPNDGSAPLPVLARQVEDAVTRVLAETGASQVDVVGFSMGTLVSRWWLQKLGGNGRTRRFIAISGPQHGTLTAWFSATPGGRDMRPGSAFLQELHGESDPFGRVEVTSFWTPLDLMIVPARSSAIPGSKQRTFWVPLHPLMTSDRTVVDAVVSELGR